MEFSHTFVFMARNLVYLHNIDIKLEALMVNVSCFILAFCQVSVMLISGVIKAQIKA